MESENMDILKRLPQAVRAAATPEERSRVYLTPQRILWQSPGAMVQNSAALLEHRSEQISIEAQNACCLQSNHTSAAILLDFGVELHGGVLLSVWECSRPEGVRVRLCFGESAAEAMSEIGGNGHATNDHAIRCMDTLVSSMSMTPVGETGFRFVRIELPEPGTRITLKTVKAVLVYRPLAYRGNFQCSDDTLNQIWAAGAYTVHLTMQNRLWDGIKRDRLVWAGDLYPETAVIAAVFGDTPCVPQSLDFMREETPLPGWMNGIPAYSMWWIITQYRWFLHTGDRVYMERQKSYLLGLHRQLSQYVAPNGRDCTPALRFVDSSTMEDTAAVDAGMQALHLLAVETLQKLWIVLNQPELSAECEKELARLRSYRPERVSAKAAAALLALANVYPAEEINAQALRPGGAAGISAFLSYPILMARTRAKDVAGALQAAREYWGGMLALGATTFWEEFDTSWVANAAPIDQLPAPGRINIHADFGTHCSRGYRKSLCHGWSAGVTAWLSEIVLGVEVLEPGCKTVRITPQLADLEWAQGYYPTPLGEIFIRHERDDKGQIQSQISAPAGITVLR